MSYYATVCYIKSQLSRFNTLHTTTALKDLHLLSYRLCRFAVLPSQELKREMLGLCEELASANHLAEATLEERRSKSYPA